MFLSFGYTVLALLRIVIIFFYFLLINLVLILVCLLRPFHRNNVYVAGKLYSSVSFFLGLKLDVRVPDSVKQGGPFVFIANHQNSYDLLTICAAAQHGTVTVGKKSLKWIPIFGQVYWLSGNIMIDRDNSGKAQDTLTTAANKIQNRKLSVWFFPEGTRSYGRGLLPFKSGAFRLAKVANAPVVTIAASNLHNKVKLNRWNNGTLIIEVSEPQLMDSSKGTKAWVGYFHQQMTQQIEKLDGELAEHL
ncbi:1-acylglycerol-3-phosphate O-acyltransferase [Flavobacterium sp. W21_SRS_FM6]|uniref:1-acylglycerol-3-phosphate O-acyltransferase n=1 Tax=Flavobacterium sp. W21_SRS_FM6 TaxID=3240268 RepID=UPI003F91ABD5